MKLQNLKEGLAKLAKSGAEKGVEGLFGGLMIGQGADALEDIVTYPSTRKINGKEYKHPWTEKETPVITTTDPRTGKTHEVKNSHLHTWVPSDRADVALASAKSAADVGIGVGALGMIGSAITPSSWSTSSYGEKIKPTVAAETATDLNKYLQKKFGKNWASNPAVVSGYPKALEDATTKRLEAAKADYSKTPKAKIARTTEILSGPVLNTAFALSDALSAAQNIRAGKYPEAIRDMISSAGTAAYFTPVGPAVTPATFGRDLSTSAAKSFFPREKEQTPEQIQTGQAPSRKFPTQAELGMGAVEAGTSIGLKSAAKKGAEYMLSQTVAKPLQIAAYSAPAVAQGIADIAQAPGLAKQGLPGRAAWKAGIGTGKAVAGMVSALPWVGPPLSTAMEIGLSDLEREEVGTREEQFQELVSNKKSELDKAIKTRDPQQIKTAKEALNALNSEILAQKAMELKAQEDEQEKQKQAASQALRQQRAAKGGPRLGGGSLQESYLNDLLLKTKIKKYLLQESQNVFKRAVLTKGQFKNALGITDISETDDEIVNESWISNISEYLVEGIRGRKEKSIERKEKSVDARETSNKMLDILSKDIETTLKTAETQTTPTEINVPATHPIVKTTPGTEAEYTPPAPPKAGDIVVTDTTIKTKSAVDSESRTSASESLPANKSERTSEIVVSKKPEIQDIIQKQPEEKQITQDITNTENQKKPEERREPREDRRKPLGEREKNREEKERSPKGRPIIPLGTYKPDTSYGTSDLQDVLSLAPGEREGVMARRSSWDPFRRRFTTSPIKITEGAENWYSDPALENAHLKELEARKEHGEFVNSMMGPKGGVFKPKASDEQFSLAPETPEEQQPLQTDIPAQQEREGVKRNVAVYDPASKSWTTQTELVAEGKLSPKESLQRKLKKQRYKISYLQDGKKVEVFASSIRGVRRVVYGKKQFRVHNSSGSDVTGYFKKLLNKE